MVIWTLMMGIFGAHPARRHGEFFVNGSRVTIHQPSDAIAAGIGFVTEYRKRFGLLLDQSLMETEDTLQEGIKRAGIPDANGGARAASIMHDWAQRTEVGLRAAKAEMRQKPTSVACDGSKSATILRNALARALSCVRLEGGEGWMDDEAGGADDDLARGSVSGRADVRGRSDLVGESRFG